MRWWWRGFAVMMLAGVGLFLVPRPASADLTGPCTGTGTLQSSGKTYDAKVVSSVTIPRSDDVDYKGTTTASGKRLAVGEVKLEMPPPLGDISLGDWGKDGKSTGSSGKSGHYHYDFPSVIAGIKFPISGFDDEPPQGAGGPDCSGHVTISIAGTSPVAWASLAFTVVSLAGVFLSIRVKGS